MKIIFNSYYTTTKRSPNPEIPGFIKIGFQTDVVKYTLFYKHCVYLGPYDFSNFSLIFCLQYAKQYNLMSRSSPNYSIRWANSYWPY